MISRSSRSRIIDYVLRESAKVYRYPANVFKDFSSGVIIDGEDDWYAPRLSHPDEVAKEANVKVLALYHTGVSGISKSGIVIDEKQLEKFLSKFRSLKKKDDWTLRLRGVLDSGKKKDFKLTVIYPDNREEKIVFTSDGFKKEK